jgi:hypothetical protein
LLNVKKNRANKNVTSTFRRGKKQKNSNNKNIYPTKYIPQYIKRLINYCLLINYMADHPDAYEVATPSLNESGIFTMDLADSENLFMPSVSPLLSCAKFVVWGVCE